MSVAVLGGGAFGTALAIALARKAPVTLWMRDAKAAETMRATRQPTRLPQTRLPEPVRVTADLDDALRADTLLLATPMQTLDGLLAQIPAPLTDKTIVACCKGLDLTTQTGPSAVIARRKPCAVPAILTGPSFAADVARGLPTALTLACTDPELGRAAQAQLSTPVLRLYRSTDVIGAELGGGLKNVMAIGCGAAIAAGMGDSARAALLTRGFAEMLRLATQLGAQPETLSGLSGLGDLTLTCTSELSRNFRFGQSLGQDVSFDASVTVEGVKTAEAVCRLADRLNVDLPICRMVHAICTQGVSIADAVDVLLARPLRDEQS